MCDSDSDKVILSGDENSVDKAECEEREDEVEAPAGLPDIIAPSGAGKQLGGCGGGNGGRSVPPYNYLF